MTAWVAGSATSRTGAQSTVMPTSLRSWAMSCAIKRAALSLQMGPRAASIAPAEGYARQCGRGHALNAAAFLIDQNRRVRAPDAIAERIDQVAQLIAIFDVALEDDEAPWIAFAKNAALPGSTRQLRSRK